MGKNRLYRTLRKSCRDAVSKNEIVNNPENQFDLKKVVDTLYKKAKKNMKKGL